MSTAEQRSKQLHLCKSKWGFWVTAWAILSTASANHPAFDPGEKQVNKEHIGDGLTLADDPEFAKKPEAAYALEDPACEEAPGWSEYRSQLMALVAIEWQDAAALAYEWMNSRGMMKTKIMDDEAKHCLPGVVASLHLLVRFSLEEDGSWESAVYMTRCLSGYASSMHPDKFDQITANGTRWPVTVAEMDSIRRRLAVASANRTTTSWKNEAGESYVGNAFTMMGTDEVEPGISMKNSVRVYVYDVEDYFELRVLARGASFCRENQWGFEVGLHEWFLACPCRTEDPLEADFFFVPHYTACHLNVETFSEEDSDALFQSLVGRLQHFPRSLGRDHLFVWGGGFGVDGPFRSWRRYIEDAIFLMTETELWNPYKQITTPGFSAWKDVLIPGRISLAEVRWAKSAPTERQYLADFVGWNRPLHNAQGGMSASSPRVALLAMAHEPDLHIRQDVPYMDAALGALSSKFCFVPRGKSAWSSRFFRVLFADCVPVLLNDFYEPPFGEIFDPSSFVVRWPMQRVGHELLETLRKVTPEAYEKMLGRVRSQRCWYVWIPSVMDHEQIDIQKGKLDGVCPLWKTQNAFIGVMRLLRTRRRASHWPSLGKAFHVPDEVGEAVQLDEQARFRTDSLALEAEEVAKACTSALLLEPKLHEAMLIRGQAQLQLGFFAACELDCSAALQAIPDSATAWATRGRARLHQKCYREAADDCQRALSLDAECRLAMSSLGAALLKLGDHQAALENCDRAVVYMLALRGNDAGEEKRSSMKAKKKRGKSKDKRKNKVERKKRQEKTQSESESQTAGSPEEEQMDELEDELALDDPSDRFSDLFDPLSEEETGAASDEGVPDSAVEAGDSPDGDGRDTEGVPGEDEFKFEITDGTFTLTQVKAPPEAQGMDRSEIEELAELYAMRAQAKVALGDLEGTIADCSAALRLNEKVPFCWAARAEAKRLQEKLEEAVADASEALRLDPLNVSAYITRAKAKLRGGEAQFVVTDCSEALALDLHQATAWSTRAAARLDLDDVAGAVSDARSAIALDPADADGWCALGGALLDSGDVVGAAEASTKALALDGDCARAWFNRGCARVDLKDLAGAQSDFNEAIDLWPESFLAFAHRAHVRLKQGDLEGAAADCEQALKMDPRLVVAICTQADLKRIKEDLKGAVVDATLALKHSPNCAAAFSIRGQSYSKMEKHDKAVQDCQRAVKLDPPTLEEPLLGWRHACACDPVPAPMSEWEIESFEAKQKAEAQAKASKEAAEKYARKAKAAAAKKSQEEAMRANLKKSRKKA